MKKKFFYSLGIMSGTSIDGLDVSLIESDGKSKVINIFDQFYKFDSKTRQKIQETIRYFNLKDNISKKVLYSKINIIFTNLLIDKLHLFFKKSPVSYKDVDVIGLHGNTIYHNPLEKLSIQIGDAKKLAIQFNIPVVYNFRTRDILNGGQGAPLVPIFHEAIFKHKDKPTMVVNIGGISNFTYIAQNNLVSSDIGPGNVLIDNYCKRNFGVDFDDKGKLSKKGNVSENLLNEWKKKHFLNHSIPISFDNYYFKIDEFVNKKYVSKVDILRTLTYFSAYLIKCCEKFAPNAVERWILCGGGTKNITLMNDIRNFFNKQIIFTAEDFGYDSTFVESQAFAYISIRTMINLPSSFNTTTGVKKNNICGSLVFPMH